MPGAGPHHYYALSVVPRPSSLRALVGVVTGLVLAVPLGASPAAAQLRPEPTPAPAAGSRGGASADDAPGRAPTASRRAAERRAAEDEYDAPLAITIDELTPGVLPRRGPIVVRGTVTNVDTETWTTINLYPMINAGPACDGCPPVMVSPEELEAATATDPEAFVGQRRTEVMDEVASLGPGESAAYSLRIPQSLLRSLVPEPTPGVYWFGVHASGAGASTPRDDFADGRARTFLPSLPARLGVVDTAVVVPLRGAITYDAEGRIARPRAWQRALSIEGALGGRLAFGAASGGLPVTWLVDPALPDAVRTLARGNPARKIVPVPQPEPSPGEDPSGDPTDGATSTDDAGDGDEGAGGAGDGSGAEAAEEDPPADDPVARAAADWLREAQSVLTEDAVVALPYGDLDIAAAAIGFPDLYGTARKHPARVLTDWGVETSPVAAPPDGYLDEAGIESIDDDATVLLGHQLFPSDAFPDGPPSAGRVAGHPLVVTDTAAATGGPGPDPRLAPVAVRQRLLSEAALRLLAAGRKEPQPLVVVLPPGLDGVGASAFWEGLDVDWLRVLDLETLRARSATVPGGPGSVSVDVDLDKLAYSDAEELAEIDQGVLVEQDRLLSATRILQRLLGEDVRVADQLLTEALAGASYSLREDPRAARRLTRARGWVEDQLEQVSIDAPNGVTLSSASGSFGVGVSNELDHAVTVRMEATTGDGARVDIPNPIVLGANSRSTVTIDARTSRPGVHNVQLRLTDLDGNPIGADGEVPIRSGQVGVVIWLIIGAGVGILFLAIAIRLVRRIRRSRAETPA